MRGGLLFQFFCELHGNGGMTVSIDLNEELERKYKYMFWYYVMQLLSPLTEDDIPYSHCYDFFNSTWIKQQRLGYVGQV